MLFGVNHKSIKNKEIMFILLLTLFFLPLLCLFMRWYTNDSAPEIVKVSFSKLCASCLPFILRVIVWIMRHFNDLRMYYVWEKRSSVPVRIREVVDKCLRVDSLQADLCVSSGVNSVRVEEAIATYDGVDYDVADMMEMVWLLGDGDSVTFNLQNIMGYENVIVKRDSDISLRVRYTGHCNTKKKTPPQTYSVRYNGDASEVAFFPPYPASEVAKKGLGVVKITSAKRNDGVCCLQETRESAGLHGKFYVDIKEPQTLVQGVVNFLDESQRIHEDLHIKIDTSKGMVEFNQS